MSTLRLELYVAGYSPNSEAAIANLRRLCAEDLAGRCRLEIVDILETPDAAEAANILVTPTLIRRAPLPIRRIIGDLSDRQTVLDHLAFEWPTHEAEDSGNGTASSRTD